MAGEDQSSVGYRPSLAVQPAVCPVHKVLSNLSTRPGRATCHSPLRKRRPTAPVQAWVPGAVWEGQNQPRKAERPADQISGSLLCPTRPCGRDVGGEGRRYSRGWYMRSTPRLPSLLHLYLPPNRILSLRSASRARTKGGGRTILRRHCGNHSSPDRFCEGRRRGEETS